MKGIPAYWGDSSPVLKAEREFARDCFHWTNTPSLKNTEALMQSAKELVRTEGFEIPIARIAHEIPGTREPDKYIVSFLEGEVEDLSRLRSGSPHIQGLWPRDIHGIYTRLSAYAETTNENRVQKVRVIIGDSEGATAIEKVHGRANRLKNFLETYWGARLIGVGTVCALIGVGIYCFSGQSNFANEVKSKISDTFQTPELAIIGAFNLARDFVEPLSYALLKMAFGVKIKPLDF